MEMLQNRAVPLSEPAVEILDRMRDNTEGEKC
jgi:hypothetical protein